MENRKITFERLHHLLLFSFVLVAALFFSRCTEVEKTPNGDPDNGGLVLPDGFEALVVAEAVGPARHIAVNDNGDIYVKLRKGGNLGLRDTDNDGQADIIEQFGDYEDEGSLAAGMRIHNGYLYFSSVRSVYRYKLTPDKLVPESEIEMIMTDDHEHGVDHWHISKPIAFDGRGGMFVPFGSPSNNCQVINRVLAATPGASGLYPCPELIDHAGVWKFDENKLGQTQNDGQLYATGLRSVVAMAWNPTDDALYTAVHGRDNLYTLFPDKFTPWQNAVLPAEEFMKVTEGSDFGWPYYYYDQMEGKRILSPEYGGDGKDSGEGDKYDQPLMAFPGHWAPNDLLFYQGDQFPERYKHGAFIAFHGSNNRAPYPQSGYFVCFVPFRDGVPTGEWEVFADGFVGEEPLVSTGDAMYRPMGLSTGPDGSLYLSDSQKGKIWRIMFKGNKREFSEEHLTSMEERKKLVHIRTPDSVSDNLDKEVSMSVGLTVYNTYCRSCHQADGQGDNNHFPSLAGSGEVVGGKDRLIDIILNGVEKPTDDGNLTVLMPPHQFLTDEYVAEVATYIRQHFGNDASAVKPSEVEKIRNRAN